MALCSLPVGLFLPVRSNPERKEISSKTISNVLGILETMCKHAAQWGHLDVSPAQYVERPRGEEREMTVLTPEEIRRLTEAAAEPWWTLWLCAVLTGMRRGGLLASGSVQ